MNQTIGNVMTITIEDAINELCKYEHDHDDDDDMFWQTLCNIIERCDDSQRDDMYNSLNARFPDWWYMIDSAFDDEDEWA